MVRNQLSAQVFKAFYRTVLRNVIFQGKEILNVSKYYYSC